VWDHLLTVCDELADGLSELEAAQGDLAAYVEAIDSDLYDLEEEVYGEELFDDEDEELDDPVVRTECPRCGEEVYFDEELLYDDGDVEISCPECGEVLYRGRTNGRGVEDEDRLASLPESQE